MNAPIVFMHMMNMIFIEYLDRFVVIFIDDILIYSLDFDTHTIHLRMVVETFCTHQHCGEALQCNFWLTMVVFSEHIISTLGVAIDPGKIYIVVDWPSSMIILEVKGFLGMVGYYDKFV